MYIEHPPMNTKLKFIFPDGSALVFSYNMRSLTTQNSGSSCPTLQLPNHNTYGRIFWGENWENLKLRSSFVCAGLCGEPRPLWGDCAWFWMVWVSSEVQSIGEHLMFGTLQKSLVHGKTFQWVKAEEWSLVRTWWDSPSACVFQVSSCKMSARISMRLARCGDRCFHSTEALGWCSRASCRLDVKARNPTACTCPRSASPSALQRQSLHPPPPGEVT